MGFDWLAYLAQFPPKLLRDPRGRRELTRNRPLLFSLLYLRHHLSSPETGDRISFSRFHLDFFEHAKQWARRDLGPAEIREAWIAPRGSGKSTLAFLATPLWALSHQHRMFVLAFADSATQAEKHLTSAKREIDSNELLRRDYPELCRPAARPTGATLADNRSLYIAESGAVFSAMGIDSSVLGAKIGSRRPDLLLFDDVEPSGSNYSAYQKDKRLATITDAVFPMNDRAVVQICGTVTMPGSIIHDCARVIQQPGEEPAQWVVDEKIRAHTYPAIMHDPDTGLEVSLWPERWNLAYMQSIASTRSFRLNMMNDPLAADGEYWQVGDFRHGEVPGLTAQLLSIDPAVTDRSKSDFTGLAVIGYSAPLQRCVVRYARAVKIPPGEQLRQLVLAILDEFPHTQGVLVEINQGGSVWDAILHDLPVKLKTVHQSAPKESRAADLLTHYQRGRVYHEQPLAALESQMVSFPKGANDDLVDAVGSGVAVFLDKLLRPKKTAGARVASYV